MGPGVMGVERYSGRLWVGANGRFIHAGPIRLCGSSERPVFTWCAVSCSARGSVERAQSKRRRRGGTTELLGRTRARWDA